MQMHDLWDLAILDWAENGQCCVKLASLYEDPYFNEMTYSTAIRILTYEEVFLKDHKL